MGFLRREQFCIGLALIINRDVRLGVLGCPNLPVNLKTPENGKGCLFVAIKRKEETQIHLAGISSLSVVLFCESVVAKHSSHSDVAKLAILLEITKPPLCMDTGCILIKEAGGIVSDINNKPLDFSLGRTLTTNKRDMVAHSNIVQQVILKK
ncbi:hypothetical protein C2G38_2166155 [Gigaspora rosea]|uniref:Uncharacterized protein n=1 Tax=Gigaspora rosea TaxID=44941 RepID=A0A397VTS7_9GLOM|nr:hypothetical protein C2G38_2166155 [Gigaspora rosea]